MLRVWDQVKQVIYFGPPPPPVALAIPWSDHSVAQNPDQENNHRTLGHVQVPQDNPPMIGLHNSNQEQSRKTELTT
jgi:hypothetical protein